MNAIVTADVRLVPLADMTGAIPYLAELFVREWEPYYGERGSGDAAADLAACCNRNVLPLALVATGAENNILGTAALKSDSVGTKTAPGPWLAALVVAPEYRNRGVASLLTEGIENEARRLGYESIYVATDSAENIVRRRGWIRTNRREDSLRGPLTVYCRRLVPGDKGNREAAP